MRGGMPNKAIADGVGRVFTPPWNKKRLPPNSPHAVRHAAAVNAVAAHTASAEVPPSPARGCGERWKRPAHAEEARSPLSPQRGAAERGLAHEVEARDSRAPALKPYPIMSLSTQMAQVSSPAKPDFSPSTIGVGQRRRVCAAIEGLAEKWDVCSAAVPCFQAVRGILAAHKDRDAMLQMIVPALSSRAKAFVMSGPADPALPGSHVPPRQQPPAAAAPEPADGAAGSSGRPGAPCMEGTRVFVGELQLLLQSMLELDQGTAEAAALTSHIAALRATLQSGGRTQPSAAPSLPPASDGAQSAAMLHEQLRQAHAARDDASARHSAAQELLAHKDALLEEAHTDSQQLSEQVSRTCAQVAQLTEKLHAMGEKAREQELVHQQQMSSAHMQQQQLQEECSALQRALDASLLERDALEKAAAFLMSPSHQKNRMVLASQLDDARNAHSELAATSAALEQEAKRGREEIAALQARVRELEEEVAKPDISEETRRQQERVRQLETEAESARCTLARLQQELEQEQVARREADGRMRESHAHSLQDHGGQPDGALKEEVETLKREVAQCRQERERIVADGARMREELDKAQRDKKALESAAAFLMSPSHQKGRMQLAGDLEEALSKQRMLAEREQELCDQVERLEEALRRSVLEVEEERGLAEDSRERVRELEEELEAVVGEGRERERERGELHGEVAKLQKRLREEEEKVTLTRVCLRV